MAACSQTTQIFCGTDIEAKKRRNSRTVRTSIEEKPCLDTLNRIIRLRNLNMNQVRSPDFSVLQTMALNIKTSKLLSEKSVDCVHTNEVSPTLPLGPSGKLVKAIQIPVQQKELVQFVELREL